MCHPPMEKNENKAVARKGGSSQEFFNGVIILKLNEYVRSKTE